MSSTSRSPDEKPASSSPEEPQKKKAPSPGRYSLADSDGAVPSTRIDSTLGMPAVRLDGPRSQASMQAVRPPNETAPASLRQPADSTKKPPVPPSAPKPADAKASADAPPPSTQRNPPPSVPRAGTPIGGVRVTPRAVELAAGEKRPTGGEPVPVAPAAPKAPPVPPRPPASSPDSTKSAPDSSRAPDSTPATVRTPESASMAVSRPVSSPPKPGTEPPLDALLLDELDEGSIAFAFDALVSEDRPSQPGTHEFDLAPVRELFAALAANHMRHVRDFMIDVKWGDVTRDWINICLPPVKTLRKAAERLDLAELGVALEKLGAELDTANAVGGHLLDANEKERLLDTYGELVTILPQAFALDSDKTQREGVIVQALLLQVPDVRKVTIDKLTAAGLTSLRELFEANANDLAHVSDIPIQLATRIVERVQAYRKEIQSASPQDARAAERDKLARLYEQLKRNHDAYEAAANGWSHDAKAQKRDHFRAREETWLEISVLLARFGEVDRLAGIEKVPFARRIAQLEDYLEEARNKYREE